MASIVVKSINSGTVFGVSTGDIIPGEIIIKITSGLYARHSVADGLAINLVCLAPALDPGDIESVIPTGSDLSIWPVMSGEVFNGRLAVGNVCAIGDVLVSDGTGKLKKPTGSPTTDGAVIGMAYAAADATSAVSRVYVESI